MMGPCLQGFNANRMPAVCKRKSKDLDAPQSRNPVTVHGAGRTDSGVHALGQVIHFDLPKRQDEEKLRFALDTQTPEDIDFIRVEQSGMLTFIHATKL